MKLLPSQQKAETAKVLEELKETGRSHIYEPCDCGSQVRHNNGGNYHEEIYFAFDEGTYFIKYASTSELVPPADWSQSSLEEIKKVVEERLAQW